MSRSLWACRNDGAVRRRSRPLSRRSQRARRTIATAKADLQTAEERLATPKRTSRSSVQKTHRPKVSFASAAPISRYAAANSATRCQMPGFTRPAKRSRGSHERQTNRSVECPLLVRSNATRRSAMCLRARFQMSVSICAAHSPYRCRRMSPNGSAVASHARYRLVAAVLAHD